MGTRKRRCPACRIEQAVRAADGKILAQRELSVPAQQFDAGQRRPAPQPQRAFVPATGGRRIFGPVP
jgi:hypothetical protein